MKAPCHIDDCEENQSLSTFCEKAPNNKYDLLVSLTVMTLLGVVVEIAP